MKLYAIHKVRMLYKEIVYVPKSVVAAHFLEHKSVMEDTFFFSLKLCDSIKNNFFKRLFC